MAAVTTKKPGGDVAVQLTFPAVFQEVYADSGEAERYAPAAPMVSPRFPESKDLQGAYHEQKRKDAHRMVMAAVQANRAAETRMLASHANYFGMPKPVLSQRIYANPSLGNTSGAIDSARRTMPGSQAPFRCMSVEERSGASGGCGSCYETQLRGGVLRTKEGQSWAAQKLQARVKQLDAIDAAALTPEALEQGVGVEYKTPADVQPFALKGEIEIAGLIGDLENAFLGGNLKMAVRFALTDLSKLVRLLARWSITASREEFEKMLASLDNIVEAVTAQAAQEEALIIEEVDIDDDELDNGRQNWDYRRLAEVILPRMVALRDYIAGMYQAWQLTPKDRKARSNALLKSTGLTRLAGEAFPQRVGQLLNEARIQRGAEEDDEEENRDAELELARIRALNIERRREGLPQIPPPAAPRRRRDDPDDDDEFDAPARPAALRYPPPGPRGVRFDPEQRAVFGARAGAYLGEAPAEEAVAAVNPFRRAAGPARLQAIPEAAQPVFQEQAALPALEVEEVGAVAPPRRAARAAPAARGPARGQRARAAPAAVPNVDIRRFFAQPGAAEPQGRGRGKRAPAKKGKGKDDAARRARSRLAVISQLIDRHLRLGEELPEFARKALEGHRAAKAAASVRRDGRTMTADEIMGLIGHVSMEEISRLAKEHLEHAAAAAPAAAAAAAPAAAATAAPKKPASMVSPSAALLVAKAKEAKEGKKSGEGKPKGLLGLTRAGLPKTREGFVELADKLKGMGHPIRVNSGSQLKSIRANFIKRLGL